MSTSANLIFSPAESIWQPRRLLGSEGSAAVAPVLGIESAIWNGLFEVEPEHGADFIIMDERCRRRTAHQRQSTLETTPGRTSDVLLRQQAQARMSC
jgi:hypothetical protein